MGVSKVIVNGVTRVDLTQDTVDETNLLSGETATGADGEHIEGALSFETQAKTVSPTENQQVVTPDAGKAGLSQVTVNAVSSSYVGSGITQRTQNDMTVSGATVTAPAGYYANSSSKSVASGTAGTPTATKGEVSNGSVTVTPSVTNTTGYITGSTKTGTAVTVSVSELESGTKTITENGTGISVSGYSMVDVNVSETYTVTIKNTGNSKLFVKYPANINGTKYYTAGDTISFHAGEELACYAEGEGGGEVTVDGERVMFSGSYASYHYILPAMDIDVTFGTNSTSGVPQVAITTNSGGVTVEPLNVTQNGTYTAPEGTAYSPVTVAVEGGSASAEAKDVNFFDYDGTIVYSYTPAEFAELTEMPANPSHARLTAQGWNWGLTDAKAYVAKYGKLNIGQMYITSSGATEIDITLTAPDLHPYLGIAPNGTVEIDWGDGTATDTVTGTSNTTLKFTDHEYAAERNYTIKLTASSGTFAFHNTSNANRGVLSDKSSFGYSDRYSRVITAIRFGQNALIGNYAFVYCTSLASVTIPNSITSIGDYYGFYGCTTLKSITIPSGVTKINGNTLANCYALTSAAIPDSITSIGNSAFAHCYALTSITTPDSVTSIGSSMFQNCYALKSITIPDSFRSIGSSTFSNC